MRKIESIEALSRHAITTLPDSTTSKKRLLESVVSALPKDNSTRSDAQAILESIRYEEQLQAEFVLAYTTVKQ